MEGQAGGLGVRNQEPILPKPVPASPRDLERRGRSTEQRMALCSSLEGASHTTRGAGPQGLEWFPIKLLLRH